MLKYFPQLYYVEIEEKGIVLIGVARDDEDFLERAREEIEENEEDMIIGEIKTKYHYNELAKKGIQELTPEDIFRGLYGY